ncbi:reverse transcriptase domain-containing protein, partial [Proteus faecis]|uniref:reverse transcriptase domain-containing protein n=1 Tax=Proteus faecis TaxID=2050967 RepID=UPI003B01D15D
MNDRLQTVDINSVKSKGSSVKIGVPQGSILGPFLFLVYINDLPYMVEKQAGIVLFADDTSLIFKTARGSEEAIVTNSTLSAISDWFT